MVPGAALCSRRAATFTASPVTISCSGADPTGATTSPVLTPIRICSLTRWSRSNPSLSASRRSPISRAARRARSASSSRTVGTPKTAMIASPMYFSTVPPHEEMTRVISPKYEPSSARSRSGSSCSPRLVEPVTSANRIETTLRCSPRSVSSPSCVPQLAQKRAPSDTRAPQVGQASAMPEVYGSAECCLDLLLVHEGHVDLRPLQLARVVDVDALPLAEEVECRLAYFAVAVAGGLGAAEGQVRLRADGAVVHVTQTRVEVPHAANGEVA